MYRTIGIILALVALWGAPASATDIPDNCPTSPVQEVRAVGEIRTPTSIWQARYSIEHRKGLVLSDIAAAGQRFLEGLRTPHFIVKFKQGDREFERTVQYCADDTDFVTPVFEATDGLLRWEFSKRFDEPRFQGDFHVRYIVRFGGMEPGCAGRGGSDSRFSAFTRRCYRFVPIVEYEWQPGASSGSAAPAIVQSVSAYFRFDYGRVGTVLVSDGDKFYTAPFSTGVHPMVIKETDFKAVDAGTSKHYDNMHTAHPRPGQRTVVVPGCRSFGYECTHALALGRAG